jgi:methylglutaconyl-CoA hydratase
MTMARTKAPAAKKTTVRNAPSLLDVTIRNAVAIVILNRPELHNAFDENLIAELTATLQALDADDAIRVVVLGGAGKSFCAGADLNWMKRMAAYDHESNVADAGALAQMLHALALLSKPTIARVHGAAMGGGAGLVACCDIAIAAQEATFAFSEGKLGLIPATIGPYVVEAIGARQARRYFLTAERFTAAEAFRIGFVHDIVPAAELDARIDELVAALFKVGPRAQMECKALIRGIAHRRIDADVIAGTAQHIAAVRASPEGQAGVKAFLEKRAPPWIPDEASEREQ